MKFKKPTPVFQQSARKNVSYWLITLLCCGLFASCNPPLSKRHVLVIGDDHAAGKAGWVYYFQQLRKAGPMTNAAVAGSTTGFGNTARPATNTLNELVVYLRRGFAEMGAIDEIIIQLGTNDCRAIYERGGIERNVNYRMLIEGIKTFFNERGQDIPRIVLMSPPPILPNSQVSEDFAGAADCVQETTRWMAEYAAAEGFCFVNFSQEINLIDQFEENGVNFKVAGLELMAKSLVKHCY